MSNIVTPEELEELTGYVQADAQARILRTHKIFYIERGDGKIRTTWHHVNNPNQLKSNDDGFNLEAIA